MHRLVLSDDLIGEVSRRIVLFAYEFHWPPREVWALTLDEFCYLADHVDAQQKARDANRKAAAKR